MKRDRVADKRNGKCAVHLFLPLVDAYGDTGEISYGVGKVGEIGEIHKGFSCSTGHLLPGVYSIALLLIILLGGGDRYGVGKSVIN